MGWAASGIDSSADLKMAALGTHGKRRGSLLVSRDQSLRANGDAKMR
jgi:hypothetical protein